MEELQKKKVVELIDESIFEIDDQKEVDELKKKKVVELRQIAKDHGIKKISGLCKARLIVVLSNVPEIMEEMRNLQRQRIILNESIPVIDDKTIKQSNTEPATNLTQSPPGKNILKSQPKDTTKPETIKYHYYCIHKRQKSRCKECGGSQICEHGKRNKAYL